MMRRAENEFIALLDSFIINALKILLGKYQYSCFPICSNNLSILIINYNKYRNLWEAIERLLRGYWEAIERLLRDFIKTKWKGFKRN